MPTSKKEVTLEKLASDIAAARDQVKRGEVYTQDQVMKELGIL